MLVLSSIRAPAGDRYAQLVFRSENSDSLWSLKAIYSMCEMEQTQVIQICLHEIIKDIAYFQKCLAQCYVKVSFYSLCSQVTRETEKT